MFHTSDGWVLQTPELKFINATSTAVADKGYLKQMALKEGGYLVGRGVLRL
jgi:hypothetical protein